MVKEESKESKIKQTIDELKERFGEGAIMKLDEVRRVNIETIPTGSISLDLALGVGGVPRGRIIEIFGPEMSGKSTVCLHVVANCQKNKGSIKRNFSVRKILTI